MDHSRPIIQWLFVEQSLCGQHCHPRQAQDRSTPDHFIDRDEQRHEVLTPSQGSPEDEDNGHPYLPPDVRLSYQASTGGKNSDCPTKKRGRTAQWNDRDRLEGQG